jgi:DNA-binding IclR family transcriptional regulator
VVSRALSLLAAFDAEHRALGLAELSRRAGIPRSTTVRLAARLVEWGALLVERLSAHGAVEIAYRVGGRMPLHDTGVGLVLLAGAGPDVLDMELARLDPPAAAELGRRLAQVQRLGIAVFDRARPAPVSSVTAPIRDHEHRVVAAVSVVVPAGVARPQSYEQVVRATARAISRGMGNSRPAAV